MFLKFRVLSYVSDEFFATSIAKISSYMKISQAMAGATLLALANGACDILTVMLASEKDNTELAIGALFGSNLFLATLALGAVLLASRGKCIKYVPATNRSCTGAT